MCFRAPFMDGVAFHDPMHEATKKPLTTVAACHCSPYSPGRQSRPHLFHVVRKVCTKSGHVSTIPPVVKNNSHHGISTIKSDYPKFHAPSTGGGTQTLTSPEKCLCLFRHAAKRAHVKPEACQVPSSDNPFRKTRCSRAAVNRQELAGRPRHPV